MSEQFTVTQEHGRDSLVEVTEDIRDGYPHPVRTLRFYTDQSLASHSGRTWNVKKTIEDYCKERGYRIIEETQHEITAAYNAQDHSYQALNSLREDIQADARYQAALADGKRVAENIQDTYGPAIAQLNSLITELKARARAELAGVAKEVGRVQNSVIADLEFPPHLRPSEQELLHRPLYQPEFNHYARYQTTPDDFDTEAIMALLR